jgi:hypothetical protein
MGPAQDAKVPSFATAEMKWAKLSLPRGVRHVSALMKQESLAVGEREV